MYMSAVTFLWNPEDHIFIMGFQGLNSGHQVVGEYACLTGEPSYQSSVKYFKNESRPYLRFDELGCVR